MFFLFSLNMESSSNCRFDRLEVYDGKYGQAQWNLTGKYCMRSHTGIVMSSGPFMKLRFRTDGSVSNQGFVARASTGMIIGSFFLLSFVFLSSLFSYSSFAMLARVICSITARVERSDNPTYFVCTHFPLD